jgi:hypothetical protein
VGLLVHRGFDVFQALAAIGTLPPVLIRDATAEDWPAIWSFMRQIVAAGDAFPYDQDMEEVQGRDMWLSDAPGYTVVAVEPDGTAWARPRWARTTVVRARKWRARASWSTRPIGARAPVGH